MKPRLFHGVKPQVVIDEVRDQPRTGFVEILLAEQSKTSGSEAPISRCRASFLLHDTSHSTLLSISATQNRILTEKHETQV